MIVRAVLLLSLLAAPSLVAAQSELDTPVSSAVLNAGDAVRITVWRRPELTGEFLISEEGWIAHPLYRDVRVGGLPVDMAEARLREYLSRLEANPQFVVEPLLRVSIGGQVRQPSLYRLPPGTTISEAIALSGGVTERANAANVRLFREGREMRIDLERPTSGPAQSPIRSGDQIFVTRRVSLLREYIGPVASITAALASVARLFR